MAATASLLAVSGMVGVASAGTGLDCGMIVLTNATLDRDLTCTGSGLEVGADGITINLGGHTLRGTGTGTGIWFGAGRQHVTVRNGTVTGFASGVVGAFLVDGRPAAFNDIVHMTVTHNRTGIAIQGAADGLRGPRAAGNRIEKSVITGNETGVHLLNAQRTSISATDIVGNHLGIRFNLDSNINTVEKSRISDNATCGAHHYLSDGTTYDGNVITGNGECGVQIVLVSRGNVLRDNYIADQPLGVRAKESDRTQLVGNTFERNGVGAFFETYSEDRVVSGNRFADNAEVGLRITEFVVLGNSYVTDNTFVRNGLAAPGSGDGFEATIPHASGTLTVTGNRAAGNADYGIQAPGVIGRRRQPGGRQRQPGAVPRRGV